MNEPDCHPADLPTYTGIELTYPGSGPGPEPKYYTIHLGERVGGLSWEQYEQVVLRALRNHRAQRKRDQAETQNGDENA